MVFTLTHSLPTHPLLMAPQVTLTTASTGAETPYRLPCRVPTLVPMGEVALTSTGEAGIDWVRWSSFHLHTSERVLRAEWKH